MIQQQYQDQIATYVSQGGWIGDIANKITNLLGMYAAQSLPAEALIHMLTEMLKMTDANGTPEDLLAKVELNTVIDGIIADAKAAWV